MYELQKLNLNFSSDDFTLKNTDFLKYSVSLRFLNNFLPDRINAVMFTDLKTTVQRGLYINMKLKKMILNIWLRCIGQENIILNTVYL